MNRNIYVVRSEAGPVKVGISGNPHTRFDALRNASAVPLHLDYAAQANGDICAVERRAHAILAGSRMSGEWFKVSSREAVAAVMQAADELGFALTKIPLRPSQIKRCRDLEPRSAALYLRTTPALKEAAERAAAAERRSLTSLLEMALIEYLREHGYLPRKDQEKR